MLTHKKSIFENSQKTLADAINKGFVSKNSKPQIHTIMSQDQCPFCHFINNQPDQIWEVAETENFYAWLEYPEPRAKGQMNIVPKQHIESVMEFSPAEWTEATNLLREVMGKVINGLGANGISVTMNVKEAGGQMLPHAYIQIFPRFEGEENAGTPTGAIFPQREDLAGDDEKYTEIQNQLKNASIDFAQEEIEPHPASQKFKQDEPAEQQEKDASQENKQEKKRGSRTIEWT